MKILITGITGLLGSYLAREFAELGEIHGLKRPSSQLRLLGKFSESIHWHEGDINDYQSLKEITRGMDLIIHAAGLVSFDPKDEDKLLKVNCHGTANVVNVMLEQGPKKLIYISSVAALGRTPDQKVIDENHKWVESDWNTPYAISKYLGELEVWRGVQEGLKAIVVNPSILLGKIKDQRSSSAIYSYVQQENKFYPLGSINYIDIRDAAKITLQLHQNQSWNERFILNKESLPYKKFFEQMAQGMGKTPPKKPLKGSLLKLALFGLWVKRIFVPSKNPLNRQTAALAQQTIEFDNTKVRQMLDFDYRDLEETFVWAMNEK